VAWLLAAADLHWSAVESLMRPFLTLPSFLGKRMSFVLYWLSLSTFSWSCSSLVEVRLWSTEMPTVRANLALRPAALISARVKPRPYLTLPAYLRVADDTTGLSFYRGLGKQALLFASLLPSLVFFF